MECKHIRERFIGYQDGDLTEDEVSAFEYHLETCLACREEWSAYQKTLEEVSGLNPLRPSDDFVSKVKQTIDKRSRGRFFSTASTPGMNFAVISFVLILFFLLAYLFFSTGIQVEVIESPKTDPPRDLDDPVDSDDEI